MGGSMRKLVIVIITILAVFTFIREYSSNADASHMVQQAAVETYFHN
jgi:hypothetical protein